MNKSNFNFDKENYPKIYFKADDYSDFETEDKGYRNDVFVEVSAGSFVEVFFYDTIRLQQDMGDTEYLSKPGLIILKIVNKDAIYKAVSALFKKGYFNYFATTQSISNNHFEENI